MIIIIIIIIVKRDSLKTNNSFIVVGLKTKWVKLTSY